MDTKFFQLPEPPEALLRARSDRPEPLTAQTLEPERSDLPMPKVPKYVDFLSFQQAMEDRDRAEKLYAELYEDYLNLLEFSKKQTRTKHSVARFRNRVRTVVDSLQSQIDQLQELRQIQMKNLAALQNTVETLEMENDSLRSSVENLETIKTQMQATVVDLDSKILSLSTKLIERENEIAAGTEKIQRFEERKSVFLKDFEGLRKNFAEAKNQWDIFHAENSQWSEKVRECLKNELQMAQLGHRFAESIHHLNQNLNRFEGAAVTSAVTEVRSELKTLPKSSSSMREILKKWEAEMDRLSSGSNSIDI